MSLPFGLFPWTNTLTYLSAASMNVEYYDHYSFLAPKHMHFYMIPLSVSLIKVKISFSVCQFKVFTAYTDV